MRSGRTSFSRLLIQPELHAEQTRRRTASVRCRRIVGPFSIGISDRSHIPISQRISSPKGLRSQRGITCSRVDFTSRSQKKQDISPGSNQCPSYLNFTRAPKDESLAFDVLRTRECSPLVEQALGESAQDPASSHVPTGSSTAPCSEISTSDEHGDLPARAVGDWRQVGEGGALTDVAESMPI
jgi:hypothetical protein